MNGKGFRHQPLDGRCQSLVIGGTIGPAAVHRPAEDRLPADRPALAHTIAIVGCGGLGVPAAWTLAAAGARRLVLVDADRVELGNLHRQVLYTQGDVGAPKAERLAAALQARFAGLAVQVRGTRVDSDNTEAALASCAAAVECSDDAQCKFAVNDWAIAAPNRTATIAAAIGRRGQWFTVRPAGPCYRCLFEQPPSPEALATCSIAGVIGPVVGIVGSLAARSLWRALTGVADPAAGALVRWTPRGTLHTPVAAADDCVCRGAAYPVRPVGGQAAG